MRNFFSEERLRYVIFPHLILVQQLATQEFRADLQAAEAKDKKFVKRKTVLKKIVANITMGNDSKWYDFSS